MEFYATNMGRRFFNSQLPLLIHALQDMTAALNRRPEAVMLPTEIEDDFLKELYYGNVGIGISSVEGMNKEKLKEITLLQEELKRKLNEEQWKLFEACSRKMTGYTSEEGCRMFQHGFRLAMKLIVAGLTVPGESK